MLVPFLYSSTTSLDVKRQQREERGREKYRPEERPQPQQEAGLLTVLENQNLLLANQTAGQVTIDSPVS